MLTETRNRKQIDKFMSHLIKPIGYKTLLDRRQTEHGIKMIKEFFSRISPPNFA